MFDIANQLAKMSAWVLNNPEMVIVATASTWQEAYVQLSGPKEKLPCLEWRLSEVYDGCPHWKAGVDGISLVWVGPKMVGTEVAPEDMPPHPAPSSNEERMNEEDLPHSSSDYLTQVLSVLED